MVKPNDKNPWNLRSVPYERQLVEFVDTLLEVAKHNGSKNQVETSYDWKTIEYIYRGWMALYPVSSNDFIESMKQWRAASNRLGVAKEKGGAMIQHKLNIPRPLHDMIKIIFPRQRWDKVFVNQFIKRYGQFKGSETL